MAIVTVTDVMIRYIVCHVLCMTSLVQTIPLGSRITRPTHCAAHGIAIYNVTFETFWSRDLFPRQYPMFRPHAQWDRLVGRSHDSSYILWRENTIASDKLKEYAETGMTSGLDLDLQGYSGVFDVFSGLNLNTGVGQTSLSLFVDSDHPLVSLVSHLVPSPDWFVGVDSESLCSGDSWITEKMVDLNIWDAGTDKGFTFTAPNWAEVPQQPVSQITASYPNSPACSFYYSELETLPTIARVTFTKFKGPESFHNDVQTGNNILENGPPKAGPPGGMRGATPKQLFGILADPGVVPTSTSVPVRKPSLKVGKKETIPVKPSDDIKPMIKKTTVRKPKLSKEEKRRLRREKKGKKNKGKRGKKKKVPTATLR